MAVIRVGEIAICDFGSKLTTGDPDSATNRVIRTDNKNLIFVGIRISYPGQVIRLRSQCLNYLGFIRYTFIFHFLFPIPPFQIYYGLN